VIKVSKSGKYSLIETFDHTKILTLDDKARYAWINASGIGDILVSTHKKFNPSATISTGAYRMYGVKNEPKLTDLVHLELFVGNGHWQGYLLPTGLPTNSEKRNRVIPTNELITVTHAI
jgi:hypothetical protein